MEEIYHVLDLYYEEFLLIRAHLNLIKGSIIEYRSLKRMFKRVSREIMGSVEYQYLKLLISTVPFLGPSRDDLIERCRILFYQSFVSG